MTMITLYSEKGDTLSNSEIDCNFFNLNCFKLASEQLQEGLGIKLQKFPDQVAISLDMEIGPEEPTEGQLLWIVSDE